ncbi:unnamed protein product [Larinioides sclopetarius]|uniref:Uncharacterized protein n=1 Tax=Larinioides sclopetarius TaxID=280406 RepID=A0AAV2AWC9_9ARAC
MFLCPSTFSDIWMRCLYLGAHFSSDKDTFL